MELSKAVTDIRVNWAIADAKRDEGLTTPEDIKRFDNISYGPFGEANLLDIYVQKNVKELQPTIVNIHGGGWVYGNKEIYQFYCMSLAERGFTVVNINYRLAPENRFPAALEDINAAITFLAQNGDQYFVDKDRLVLVGDSAGGQLTSHYATILTNPEFAKLFAFTVPNVTVKALGLNCGTYNAKSAVLEGPRDVLAEYLDLVDKKPSDELIEKVSVFENMTADFPPSFVMSAVNDFCLVNAEPMYEQIKSLGVPCKMKVYGTKEQKEIAHVFHVNVKLTEATQCNDDECEFFKQYV